MGTHTGSPDEPREREETDLHRTPGWWQELPAWLQVALLAVCLPGVLLHEYTHIAAGYLGTPVVDRHRWDLDEIGVECWWAEYSPAWRRGLLHLAPMLAGVSFGLGAMYVLAVLQPGFEIRWLWWVYIAGNFAVYVGASAADLIGIEYFRIYFE